MDRASWRRALPVVLGLLLFAGSASAAPFRALDPGLEPVPFHTGTNGGGGNAHLLSVGFELEKRQLLGELEDGYDALPTPEIPSEAELVIISMDPDEDRVIIIIVPEPGTAWLVSLGLVGLARARRRAA